jgi:hypothetical protein
MCVAFVPSLSSPHTLRASRRLLDFALSLDVPVPGARLRALSCSTAWNVSVSHCAALPRCHLFGDQLTEE